ncbi:MAG: hypothetical protein KKD38_02875 [Candidatus Delongbacteria bacterium]|nr:hypothetical protein [Candidatus Delongbacteria bacterium]
MKKLFVLTNAVGNIPQKIMETDTISTDKIKKYFIERYFNVFVLTYDELITDYKSIKDLISGSYFFYASSQYPEYYSAFEDILLLIKENGGILIPEFSHFRSHENKFFQELIKTDLKIISPQSWLISSLEEGLKKIPEIDFPIVAKLSTGFGSKSVSLLKNRVETIKYLKNNLITVIKKRKNIFKYFKQISYLTGKHPLKVGKIILQEYIDGIENDWKILVFGNRIFYLKRYFRENDFRASGSGNFDGSVHPDESILKFALSVKNSLKTPWVSLDIIQKAEKTYLIEYQCVHFGLYTVMKSTEHFHYVDGAFRIIKAKVDEDILFAEELYNYINDMNGNK